MRSSLFCFLTLALTTAPVVSALRAQPTPAPPPSYPAPAYSVTVPFAVAVDFNHLDTTLKLLTAVNGGPAHAFTIDTGSVGVVLPATEIPGFDPKAPDNTPGELRYSSSGLTLDGFWTVATVRFLNPTTQQPMAEAAVQVLAVTQGSCQGGGANAGRCTGAIPHMLGVGFGRGGDAANGMQTQANNPFVNLAAMNALEPLPDGRVRHGYLITHAGITFGLTDPETRSFQFVKLTPAITPLRRSKTPTSTNPGAPSVTASPSRVGSAPTPTASLAASSFTSTEPPPPSVTSIAAPPSTVISTGAPPPIVISTAAQRSGETPVFAPAQARPSQASPSQASSAQAIPPRTIAPPPFTRDYITAPGFLTLGTHDFPMGVVLIDTGLTNMIVEEPNEPSSGDLEAGQPVTVHLLGDQLRYRFTTGSETTTVAPRRATWATYTHGSFLNTGLRALACFDYLYDADNGYLGLRPTCTAR